MYIVSIQTHPLNRKYLSGSSKINVDTVLSTGQSEPQEPQPSVGDPVDRASRTLTRLHGESVQGDGQRNLREEINLLPPLQLHSGPRRGIATKAEFEELESTRALVVVVTHHQSPPSTSGRCLIAPNETITSHQ